jgi:tetratricopeptide (TPR) repeat protein
MPEDDVVWDDWTRPRGKWIMDGSWQRWIAASLMFASVGCSHFRSRNSPPQHAEPIETHTMSLFNRTEATDPKPETMVALGDVRLEASHDESKTPLECENLRNEARRAYQAALDTKPDFAPAIKGMAKIYEDQGMGEQAIAQYARITQLSPKDGDAWFVLGVCQGRRAKDWEAANQSFQRAIEIEPDNQRYRRWLGWTLAIQGSSEEAMKQLVLVMPEPQARREVAEIAHVLNRPEEARRQIGQVLQKEPNNPEVREIYSALHKQQDDSGIQQTGGIIVSDPPRER